MYDLLLSRSYSLMSTKKKKQTNKQTTTTTKTILAIFGFANLYVAEIFAKFLIRGQQTMHH